jgi:RNA polymerase sigma-70 factor (ECF subfamily)
MSTTTSTEQAETGHNDFTERAEQYRRELFAHCYRMSGSVHEAEDLVQETFLRAWRGYGKFEERASMRTWLHRIATNVCLTSLEGATRRPLPTGLGQPASDPSEPVHAEGEVPWLSPVPDAMVASSPEGAAESHEGVRLAFVAALQHLPPRQRAALLLRDVLQWKAAEVAEAVGTSTAAVNSALQRARETVRKAELDRDNAEQQLTPEQNALLERYVRAFWDKDIDALVSMFTDKAVWEMPPFPGWYQGPDAIGTLIGTQCPGGPQTMTMVPTTANGQPAFAMYMQQADGSYTPFHLQVLTLDGDRVSHVGAFFDHSLFEKFGLPPMLPPDAVSPDGVPAP